ncbi:hypothetical protein M427DRAFT_501874 [Gonapodya prolifera JEL478]|uniref:Histidine kinase n=1 Tax=Gonapodya prolifera (strain JEL478) TaxID=1344416 RepID=A0A139A877_GONPJ|nr:hypothetical protein M427DRAFT_501874 [Gonapodya prolifera JEL478]|eukprot:KXS13002.1 hypothetical protein M427DRAFT_501874 [Gonapodya prolifera JEL478]
MQARHQELRARNAELKEDLSMLRASVGKSDPVEWSRITLEHVTETTPCESHGGNAFSKSTLNSEFDGGRDAPLVKAQYKKSFDVFRCCYSNQPVRRVDQTLADSFYNLIKELVDAVSATITRSDMDNNTLFALKNKYLQHLMQCSFDDICRKGWIEYLSVVCGASAPIGDGSNIGLWNCKDGTSVNRHFENELSLQNIELACKLQCAESASCAKDWLVAIVLHELRTPLNRMMGTARLLQESESLDADQIEQLDALMESGEALKTVIDDLLAYSSMELGKARLIPTPFSLRSVCRSVVITFRASTLKKLGVSLSLHIDDSIPDTLMGDAVRPRQVLINLVGNALKFMEEWSVTVVVCVAGLLDGESGADTGRGIPPELQDRLFKPFSQVDQVSKYSGTGLGLSISKQIVKMMSGRMWMESAGRRGDWNDSTAESRPRRPGARPPPFVLSPQSPLYALDPPLRVLLTEDNPMYRMVATKFLAKLGVRPDNAHDGEEAFDMWERGCGDGKGYGVVLMDGQMPKLPGLEAARIIRSLLPHLQQPYIIALTANVTEGDIAQALCAGIQEHLGEPVTLEDLMRVPERAVVEVRGGAA